MFLCSMGVDIKVLEELVQERLEGGLIMAIGKALESYSNKTMADLYPLGKLSEDESKYLRGVSRFGYEMKTAANYKPTSEETYKFYYGSVEQTIRDFRAGLADYSNKIKEKYPDLAEFVGSCISRIDNNPDVKELIATAISLNRRLDEKVQSIEDSEENNSVPDILLDGFEVIGRILDPLNQQGFPAGVLDGDESPKNVSYITDTYNRIRILGESLISDPSGLATSSLIFKYYSEREFTNPQFMQGLNDAELAFTALMNKYSPINKYSPHNINFMGIIKSIYAKITSRH